MTMKRISRMCFSPAPSFLAMWLEDNYETKLYHFDCSRFDRFERILRAIRLVLAEPSASRKHAPRRRCPGSKHRGRGGRLRNDSALRRRQRHLDAPTQWDDQKSPWDLL